MWCVKLSDSQRDALRALIKAPGRAGPLLTARARGARPAPAGTTCPRPTLPWERVAELAARQGIGEADVVWDLAAGMRRASAARAA